MMFGWRIRDAARASRTNRSMLDDAIVIDDVAGGEVAIALLLRARIALQHDLGAWMRARAHHHDDLVRLVAEANLRSTGRRLRRRHVDFGDHREARDHATCSLFVERRGRDHLRAAFDRDHVTSLGIRNRIDPDTIRVRAESGVEDRIREVEDGRHHTSGFGQTFIPSSVGRTDDPHSCQLRVTY